MALKKRINGFTAFDLYAVPQDQGSKSYGARSESVIISQDADNQPVKLSFVETGSNNHSVGPHKVYAAVRNKWSGEEKTVFLGDIEVYMDFVCGVQYQTTFSGSYETRCYATFLNGAGYFNRTTCDQTLASLNAKVKVMPGFTRTDLSSGSSFSTTVTAMGAVSPSSPCVGRVYPAVPGSSNLLYGLTYNYTPGYSGSGNIDEFTGVIIGNGPTYGPAALAKDCGAHVDMVFTDSDYPYNADLDIDYKIMGTLKDSDNNGYYVFHWLDDVCASSLGWLNVFYDYR